MKGDPSPRCRGSIDSGRVIYVGTFSKVLCPAMRLAYMVVPQGLVAPIGALKFLIDYHTPTFEQEVLADFLAEGHFERHLRRSRRRNAARRDALLDAAARHLGDRVEVVGTGGGVHAVMWLRHYHHSQIAAIAGEANQHGVGLYPVTPYYLQPPSRAGLLLGYACLDEGDIRRGIAVLAQSLDKVRPTALRRRPRPRVELRSVVRAR